MTEKEHKTICLFLKDHRLNQQELFEEFYDHIVSSFEDRLDKSQNIQHHLNQILADFGGTHGIRKILISRHQIYGKIYSTKLKRHFWSFFQWPLALYTALTFASIYLLTLIFPAKGLFTILLVLVSLTPIAIGSRFAYKFWMKCKREDKAYRSKLSHSAALKPALLLTLPIHVWNMLNSLSSMDLQLAISTHILLTTTLAILLITFAFACMKLMTEANTEKMTTV